MMTYYRWKYAMYKTLCFILRCLRPILNTTIGRSPGLDSLLPFNCCPVLCVTLIYTAISTQQLCGMIFPLLMQFSVATPVFVIFYKFELRQPPTNNEINHKIFYDQGSYEWSRVYFRFKYLTHTYKTNLYRM